MSDVASILLIPAEGDPRGMLREGPCGARPPCADVWLCPVHGRVIIRNLRGYLCSGCEAARNDGPALIPVGRALVLAWQGEVVPEGCLRAWMAWTGPGARTSPFPHAADLERWLWWARNESALWSLGTLVLLDADGREVSP